MRAPRSRSRRVGRLPAVTRSKCTLVTLGRPHTGPVTFPVAAPAGRPLPAFTTRLLARLIDAVVYSAVGCVLGVPTCVGLVFAAAVVDTSPTGTGSTPYDPDPTRLFGPSALLVGAAALAMIVFGYLYEVELVLRRGATVGKRATGIRVVTVTPSTTPDRRTLTVRYLCLAVLGGCVPLFWLLDGVWQLWDRPHRQCLHDKAAGTVVIETTAAPST